MKDTLEGRVIPTGKSKRHKTVEIKNNRRNFKSTSLAQTKRTVPFDENDLSIMEKLVTVGKGGMASEVSFPAGFGSVDRFSELIVSARRELVISDLEKFFCFAGLASCKPLECGRNEPYKRRFTIALDNIIERILLNLKMNKSDKVDFEKTVERIQQIVDFDELDPVFVKYREMKVREKKEKTLKEIHDKLSKYDFVNAESIYLENQGIMPTRQYEELVEKSKSKQQKELLERLRLLFERFDFASAASLFQGHEKTIGSVNYEKLLMEYSEKFSMKKLREVIVPYLEKFDFASAEKLYVKYENVVWLKHYEKAKNMAFLQKLEKRFLNFFEKGDYSAADELANSNSQFPKDRYLGMKTGFVAKDISALAKSRFTPKDVYQFAMEIIQEAPELANNLNADGVAEFVANKLPKIVSPPEVYCFLIERISKHLKEGMPENKEEVVYRAVYQFLASNNISHQDKETLWDILSNFRPVLSRLADDRKHPLAKIADLYPYDRINELAPIYMPQESYCLIYLKNSASKSDLKQLGLLKEAFQKRRYFNCEMIVAIYEAVGAGKKIHIKDILFELLRVVVNRAFSYNDESKSKIENHIFPKCISDRGADSFAITERDFIFCEGVRAVRKDGSVYMRCRNHKCTEMTDYLNESSNKQTECYFFRLLESIFGFQAEQIFSDEDFSLAMGSFNRWNEIGERLVCRYPDGNGCGSTLIFDSITRGRPGWQAYATTYWHCSNNRCHNQEKIKLSYCKGCREIIDSRIDKYSCPRKQKGTFYVCTACGFCCDEHFVSGMCPHCGEIGLESADNYDSIYRCQNPKCRKKVKTPLRLSSDQKNTLLADQGTKKKQTFLEPSIAYDNISSDDIPF